MARFQAFIDDVAADGSSQMNSESYIFCSCQPHAANASQLNGKVVNNYDCLCYVSLYKNCLTLEGPISNHIKT